MDYLKKAAFAGAGTALVLFVLGKVSPTMKAKILDPSGKA